jgi:hypothetical protein
MSSNILLLSLLRNIDALFDPFADLPKIGLSIFRLTERIHQFHGNGIWWCPITPLAAHEEAHLKSKMWALWTAIDPFEAFKRSYPEINTFLFQQFRVGRHVWDVCELYSPNVIASIIRETGLEMNIGETALTVTDIVNQEIFQTPLPIRVQKLQIPFTHSSTEPSWKTPSLNSSTGAMDSQSQPNLVNGAGPTQLTPEMAADLQANPDMMQHPAFLQAVAQHQQHLQQQAHALMMMQQHPSQVQQQGYYPYMMPVPYPAFSSSGSRLRALIPELNIAPENPEFPGSELQPTNYFGNDTTPPPPLETGITLEQANGSRSSSDADSTPTASDTPLSDSPNNLNSVSNNITLNSSGSLNKLSNNVSASPPSKTPTVIPGGDSGALASSILHSNLTRPTGGTRSSTLPRPSPPSAPTPTSTPASSISGLSLSSTLPPVPLPFTQSSPRSSSTSQLPTTQTPSSSSSSSASVSTLKASLGPSKPKTPPAPKFHTLPHPPSSGPSGAPVSTLTLPRPKPALPPKPANLPVTRNLESSSNGE